MPQAQAFRAWVLGLTLSHRNFRTDALLRQKPFVLPCPHLGRAARTTNLKTNSDATSLVVEATAFHLPDHSDRWVEGQRKQATPRPRLPTRARGTLRLSLLLRNISKCYPLGDCRVYKFQFSKPGPPAHQDLRGSRLRLVGFDGRPLP